MDEQFVSILFSEGSKLLSHVIRQKLNSPRVEEPSRIELALKPFPLEETRQLPPAEEVIKPPASTCGCNKAKPPAEKATSVQAGCVPCSLGHLGTCNGLLNEAMRFANNKDGIASPEVLDRVNTCLDELNALERVDLRPELMVNLPPWEKDLAERALLASRETRHGLESIRSKDDLEQLAAKTTTVRKEIGREWFQGKLSRLSPEEQAKVKAKVEELKAEAAKEPIPA